MTITTIGTPVWTDNTAPIRPSTTVYYVEDESIPPWYNDGMTKMAGPEPKTISDTVTLKASTRVNSTSLRYTEAAVIKDRVKRKLLRKLFDQLASSDAIKINAIPSKGGSVTFTCEIEVVKPRDNENETTKA